jgi:hypothetical protein
VPDGTDRRPMIRNHTLASRPPDWVLPDIRSLNHMWPLEAALGTKDKEGMARCHLQGNYLRLGEHLSVSAHHRLGKAGGPQTWSEIS